MGKPAKRRPMLNEPGYIDPRDPANWGVDDAAKARAEANKPLIEQWRDEGNLQDCMEAAIKEIEVCHRAICEGLWTKTASYGERVSGGADRDWPAWLALAIRDRYGPWRDAMARRRIIYNQPIHELVTDALIDNVSLRTLDASHQWRKGTAKKFIRWGLHEYAVMAGWIQARSTECQ